MPTQTKDILQKIESFHRNMANVYTQLQTLEQVPKVQMLLQYLEKHETNMETELSQFSKESSKKVLESWFTYSLDEKKLHFMNTVCIDANIDVEDLVQIALISDDYLTDLYSQLTAIADNRDAKSIFASLLQNSGRERRKLVQFANSDF